MERSPLKELSPNKTNGKDLLRGFSNSPDPKKALNIRKSSYVVEFPIGSMGLELEPVIISKERKIGCRVRGFYYSKDHYGINSNELERQVSKGDIISTIQDKSVISSPFDRILTELMTLKSRTKSIGFKSVDPENTTPTKHRSNKSFHSEGNNNIKKERKSYRKIINTITNDNNKNNNNNNTVNKSPTKSTLTPTKYMNETIIRKDIKNTGSNIVTNNNNDNNINGHNSGSGMNIDRIDIESCLSPSKIKSHVRSAPYKSLLTSTSTSTSTSMHDDINTSLNRNMDVLINAMTMLDESNNKMIDNHYNNNHGSTNSVHITSDINVNDMSILSNVSNIRLDEIPSNNYVNIEDNNDGDLTPIKTNASYHYDCNDNDNTAADDSDNNNNNKLNNALSTIVYPLVGGVGKTLGVLGSVGAMGFNLTSKLLNGSDDDIDQVASVIPMYSNDAMSKAMNAKNALLQELSKSALQLGQLEKEALEFKNREKQLVGKVTLLEESNIHISKQLEKTTEGTLALTEAGVEAIKEGEALHIELKHKNEEVSVLRNELCRVETELREATLRLIRKEYESKPIIAMVGTQTIEFEDKDLIELKDDQVTNSNIINTIDIAINTDNTNNGNEIISDIKNNICTEDVMVQTLRTMMQDDAESEIHSSEILRLSKSIEELKEAKMTITELQDEMSALLHLNKRMTQQNNDYKYSLSNIEKEKKDVEHELNGMKLEIHTLIQNNKKLEQAVNTTSVSTSNDKKNDELINKTDTDISLSKAVSNAVNEAITKNDSQHEIEMNQLKQTIELLKLQHAQEIKAKDELLMINKNTNTATTNTDSSIVSNNNNDEIVIELNNTTKKLREEMQILEDNTIELIAQKEKECQRAECHLKELELNKTLHNNEKERYINELNEGGVANEVLRLTLSDMESNMIEMKRKLELNNSEMDRVCRERDALIEQKLSKELLYNKEKDILLSQIKDLNNKLDEMKLMNDNLKIDKESSMNELLKVNSDQNLLRKEMNESLLLANQRLNKMEDEKTSNLLDKTNLNEEYNALKKELQLKITENNTLKNNINNNDEKSHLLELELEKLTSLLDKNSQDKNNHNSQINSLNNELNSVNQLYSDSCMTIDKLKESLSIAMEEGRRAQTTAEKSLLNNNELKKEVKELSYKINEMSNIKISLDSSENELEKLQKLIKIKNDDINNLEENDKIRTISFKKAEVLWNKRITEIENDYKSKLKDQTKQSNNTLEKLKNDIANIKNEKDLIKKNAKSAVSAFDKQIISLQEEHMKSVENNRKDRNRLITAFEKRIKDLTNQLTIVTDNSRNKKKEVDLLKNMIDKDSNVVSELSSQLTQTKKAFSILQNDEIKLKSICQQLDSKNNTLINSNKELRTNNIKKDSQLETLTNELEKLKDRVLQMQEVFNEENNSIDIIKSEAEGYRNDVSNLTLRLKESNDELYESKNRIREIEKQYNIACNDIKSNKSIIDTLKNEKDMLSSLLISKRKEFDELHVRLTELLCGESFNTSFNDNTHTNNDSNSPTMSSMHKIKTKSAQSLNIDMNDVVVIDNEIQNDNNNDIDNDIDNDSGNDYGDEEIVIASDDDSSNDDSSNDDSSNDDIDSDGEQEQSLASNFFDVSADSENLMLEN